MFISVKDPELFSYYYRFFSKGHYSSKIWAALEMSRNV
jgi:heme exporter protein D